MQKVFHEPTGIHGEQLPDVGGTGEGRSDQRHAGMTQNHAPPLEFFEEGVPDQAGTVSRPPCPTEDVTLPWMRMSLYASAPQRTPLQLMA